jgi:hypothetical protein
MQSRMQGVRELSMSFKSLFARARSLRVDQSMERRRADAGVHAAWAHGQSPDVQTPLCRARRRVLETLVVLLLMSGVS